MSTDDQKDAVRYRSLIKNIDEAARIFRRATLRNRVDQSALITREIDEMMRADDSNHRINVTQARPILGSAAK